ncbi:Endonuclease/exonuclease/phosphatase [Zychaea mexicana]|uniref:Endonuclease/exonuclease/phosphatase n=1 Tax=Zychaea mexicana TaxID=64656 RepID=UPI0022FDD3EB|nr:Endonuclease/exonuclease/phosphatase [Zychaea mexicana]KAI9497417.1 Endonuclease/exonuclease/phosphatase [Zychaea mexicana]
MTPSVIPTGHKSTKNAVAISGAVLATGAHETRIWDTKLAQCLHTIDGNGSTSGSGGSGGGSESNDKVCALEFAPTLEPRQEGQYLWVGSKDGELVVIDTMSGKVIARPHSTHTQAIIWILRYKNTEMWTIDEGGVLNVWEVLDGIRLVEEHVVTPRAAAALIVGRELWMATTRAFEVHRFGVHNLQQQQQQQPGPRVRIPNELGDIVQLTTVPYHVGKIFIGHGNGKVSVWDAKTMERLEVITVSMYAISCMVSLGEYHLWMGFNTGMIYVYDTRPERWLVVKLWKAHESGVTNFVVDKIGLALDEPTVQVVSLDSHGYASFWDGLLSEHWKGQQMEKFRADYSVEQDTRILICSWNIDANKPEKLPYNDDQLVRAWLSGMRDPDPDIIVVGIQEIVDLESKKQTARSLFASRKKIETLQEADELLTHRYTLWHDYLARVIADNYGRGAYTVIKTDQLVGLFSCIFVRSSELRRVSAVESTVVKTGMKVMKKSLHGNKGGIAIRLQMDDSSLCFVNCHLAAGQSHQAQRNTDAEGILKEAVFPARPQDVDAYPRGGDGTLILDHEHCFLSGDLNYRINMHREKVLQHLASRNAVEGLAALQKEDQLLKQRYTNPFFKLLVFQESPIHFLPTYKYDPGTDYYDRSEKKRVPAWCDRILYRSNGVQNLFYQRHEVLASDHRPISGGFIVRVKRVDQSQKARVAHNVEQAWQQHYQQLVNEHKAMYVGDFNIQDAVHQLQAVNWDVHQIRY